MATQDARRPHPWWLVGIGVALVSFGLLFLLGRPVESSLLPRLEVAVALSLAAAAQLVATRRWQSRRVVLAVVWVVGAVVALAWAFGWGRATTGDLALLLGGTVLAGGVVQVLLAARVPRASGRGFPALAGALTDVLLGSAVLLWPSISSFVLQVLLAVWSVLVGARTIALGLDRWGRRRVAGGPPGRWGRRARSLGSVAMLLVALVVVSSAVLWDVDTTPEPGPFYATPAELEGAPGGLIRQERIEPFVDGATAHRVLYASRGLDGEETVGSGLVIVPDGDDVPEGGRPVLAFTHGTVGIDRSCAPSLLDGAYAEHMWGLDALLDAGWIIAAPDYIGLGTEGPHPYLVGEVAATSTLDAVRAARDLVGANASSRFAVAGHSQGGHAALFTGQLADGYAPELELVGVAALAPASELASFIEANEGSPLGNLLGAYAVVAWSRAFVDIDDRGVISPLAAPVIEELVTSCITPSPEEVGLVASTGLLEVDFLTSPPWATEPWASRIAENTPGGDLIDAPLLIVQGTDDLLIREDIQRAFVERLCAAGQALEYRPVPGAGHLSVDDDAAADVVAWLGERLSTAAATSTCASP